MSRRWSGTKRNYVNAIFVCKSNLLKLNKNFGIYLKTPEDVTIECRQGDYKEEDNTCFETIMKE